MSTLDRILKLSLGCSLRETLAWALLLSLWGVFISFVVSLTIAEYAPGMLLPCKLIGVCGAVTGAFAGGWLIMLRSQSPRGGAGFRTSKLSSDW